MQTVPILNFRAAGLPHETAVQMFPFVLESLNKQISPIVCSKLNKPPSMVKPYETQGLSLHCCCIVTNQNAYSL